MSHIIRIVKTEIMQVRGFCGSRRNMSNHYETLRIPQNASQDEIRQAFIKLSKEMHPDTSKNSSHANFVKIVEAYKILSKEHAKREYDMELNMNQTHHGRPVRIVYYDSNSYYHMAGQEQGQEDVFGKKGPIRTTKVSIAFLLFLLSSFGVSIVLLLINNKGIFGRNKLLEQTLRNEDAYRKLKEDLSNLTQEERIKLVEDKMTNGQWP